MIEHYEIDNDDNALGIAMRINFEAKKGFPAQISTDEIILMAKTIIKYNEAINNINKELIDMETSLGDINGKSNECLNNIKDLYSDIEGIR